MTTCQNLGTAERLTSLVLGATSMAAFLRRDDKARSWPLVAFAGAMLLRGAAAYCPAKQLAAGSTCATGARSSKPGKRAGSPEESWTERKDLVQEASEESFPASDAPSFNPGAIH